MQAIATKYIGPTDYKGSRVKATCEAGSITLHWDDAADSLVNHDRAAVALADKLGWSRDLYGEMVRGEAPTSSPHAYVYVFTGKNNGHKVPR